MKDLLKLNRYFLKYKWTLLTGSVLLIAANFFLIWIPILVRRTIDEIERMADDLAVPFESVWSALLSEEVGSLLLHNSVYLTGAVLIYGLLLFATRQTLIVTSRKIEFDLRNEIYQHLQKLPQSFYDKSKSGDTYTRSTEDVVRVREYFGPSLMYMINTFARAGIILTIMIMVHPGLTFWALLPLPFLAILVYRVSRLIHRRSGEIQQQYALMASKIQEIYSSIRLIKAFNRETYETERFLCESKRYRKKKLKLDLVESFFHPVLLLLIGSSIILVLWQGGLMVMQGAVSIGNIAEFIIYVNYLAWPVASLGYTLNLLQRSAASNTRIQELMNTPVEQIGYDKNGDKDRRSTGSNRRNLTGSKIQYSAKLKKELVFDNVTFTYPGAESPALENITMHVKAGERVGIVGRTGSGKTSLIQLLPRIHDPEQGRILLDGIDIRNMDLSALRSLTGYVPQDHFLFSESIAENIAFGKENANREEIRMAAKQAGILENILEFEKKFDTILGERGITLSGGQKQRTSIARALVRKPSILILDDSLSAVDAKTEQTIVRHLDSELPNSTIFIVSHRLSSLRNVDIIHVLKEGRIVESGIHEELMARDGHYAKMYRKQQLEEELKHL